MILVIWSTFWLYQYLNKSNIHVYISFIRMKEYNSMSANVCNVKRIQVDKNRMSSFSYKASCTTMAHI